MRNEALQGAVTTVERAYGQLAVAPFTPSWRNDYMLNTMLHHPWGPIIEYFAYVSQLQGIFPHETRASLHELRQWALATRERTETLLGLVYSRDWHQLKDTPAVREAFDSWLEQMALQDAGEQDEGYQAHRRGGLRRPRAGRDYGIVAKLGLPKPRRWHGRRSSCKTPTWWPKKSQRLGCIEAGKLTVTCGELISQFGPQLWI